MLHLQYRRPTLREHIQKTTAVYARYHPRKTARARQSGLMLVDGPLAASVKCTESQLGNQGCSSSRFGRAGSVLKRP